MEFKRPRKSRRPEVDLNDPEVRGYLCERELEGLMGTRELEWDNHGARTAWERPISRIRKPKHGTGE